MSKWLKILGVLCLVAGVCVAVVVFHELEQFKPVDSAQTKKVSFTVKKGETAYDVGADLQTKNLIRDPLAFQIYVWKNHLAGKIMAGSFNLSQSMTVQQIALELTTTPTSARVTIKEGLRREEMADFLASQELTVFDKDEFLTLSKGKEGYLFPDTYIFSKEESTQTIYNELTKTFDSKVAEGMSSDIGKSGHSMKDIVIMASLIQREARGPQATAANPDPVEMKIISGILWKRIELGIPLGVDATLQYLKGYDSVNNTWWSTSGITDLKSSNSGFNTYKNLGLPPAPISNPGLYAFQAAITPTDTDYLFYLHDNNGKVHYAKTLEEHNKNVDTYLR